VLARGSNGDCTGIPEGATGLSLNVTAVGATQATFVTLWPTGSALPTTSNLNPLPGQGPTPNATMTGLSGDGQFDIYNAYGSVDMIVDVVGYYTDHHHSSDDIVDEPGIGARNTVHNPLLNLGAANTVVGDTRIRVPANGFVSVEATIQWAEQSAGEDTAECQLTRDDTFAASEPDFRLNDFGGVSSRNATVSAQRTFTVAAADNVGGPLVNGQDFNVVCRRTTGAVGIVSVYVTAQYFPTSYAPGPFQG
jgi:hypothetical protein